MTIFELDLQSLSWIYFPVQDRVRKNYQVDRVATIAYGLSFGVLSILRNYRHAQAKDITPTVAGRREEPKKVADLPGMTKKGHS